MEVFDAADTLLSCRRARAIHARSAALELLNGADLERAAAVFAARLIEERTAARHRRLRVATRRRARAQCVRRKRWR